MIVHTVDGTWIQNADADHPSYRLPTRESLRLIDAMVMIAINLNLTKTSPLGCLVNKKIK